MKRFVRNYGADLNLTREEIQKINQGYFTSLKFPTISDELMPRGIQLKLDNSMNEKGVYARANIFPEGSDARSGHSYVIELSSSGLDRLIEGKRVWVDIDSEFSLSLIPNDRVK